jgi:hypothetical protein
MPARRLEHFEKLYTSKEYALEQYYNQPGVKKIHNYSPVERKKDGYVPERNEHKNKPIDGQFLGLSYNKFFKNEGLMKRIANKTGLLLVLLQNVVDWNKNEKLNLYEDYFVKRRLLVASISRMQLARIFGKESVVRLSGQPLSIYRLARTPYSTRVKEAPGHRRSATRTRRLPFACRIRLWPLQAGPRPSEAGHQ